MSNWYLTKVARGYNGEAISGVGKTGLVHAKKMKLAHQIAPYTKLNWK